MESKKVKLTKDKVNKMLAEYQASGATGRKEVFDTEIRGFLVRLSATKATYCVTKRVNGKLVRTVIGDHGVFLPDHIDPKLNARKRAAVIVADMESGVNPNEEKKQRKEQGLTVSEALENYFLDNPTLKENTIKIYRGLIHNHAPEWLKKPVKSITNEMVLKKHTDITRKGFKESANKFVRTVRAVFYQNKQLLPENPAKIPSKKWNPSERRTTLVMAHQLPEWFIALSEYKNQDLSDYLMLLLLSGLRRSEGFSLLWKDIDLKGKMLIARDTKNGKDHTLPLSDYIVEILERRKADKINEYVFPSLTSTTGHLVEPKKAIASVSKKAGFKVNAHDLRRTFMSAAAGLGISETLIKRLVNHSIQDVTGGYIFDFEQSGPHRKMQEITDLILDCITRPTAIVLAIKLLLEQRTKQAAKEPAKVINIEERRAAA